MINLNVYSQNHRKELEQLLESSEWQRVIKSGLVDEVKNEKLKPNKVRNFIDTVIQQLLKFNEERVKKLYSEHNLDDEEIFAELSKWPEDMDDSEPVISFLGLNLTPECNFRPKCLYCNQPWTESKLTIQDWKDIIKEVTEDVREEGPYIYFTGGEPLLLGEDLWGDNGLIKYATERGAGLNVNTNASMITPEIALRFIKSGLGRLHISLDTSDKDTQNFLFGGERFDRVMQGIYNIQIARDLVGVGYPIIHTNCVLTKKNMEHFPELFQFILDKHKQTGDKSDPFFNDLFTHVVPVGGDENEDIRPSAEDFRKFYTETWETVSNMWSEYQDKMGVPPDKRGELFGYFSNPFLRVKHKGGIDAYVKEAAKGRYGSLALSDQCYVAPTQAAFTPDGKQYRCGSHAIRHVLPLGSFPDSGVFDNIKAGISSAAMLPQEKYCYGCALATLYINQSVESKLKEKVKEIKSV
ncbi:radical SAM protein [Candidatus Poribacteria bacterium]|nr:radical SAM protein [Candidatus Poribacteria bacterium]